ncbi:LicD family protein [Clostridium amazonitimonense]|uniref:LicD family protein n=1 Tax=Clostridium amazonitimonense TaxID=1499689 RepID=UPI00068E7900|nr:LicD family protein [Clostridium amazonitimonense]
MSMKNKTNNLDDVDDHLCKNFKEDNRLGQVVPCSLEEAQDIMLSILKEVHSICQKYGLTYFITDGTLLGAVRHKGFIPWDDDLDIAMPRNDYEIFKEIAREELSKEFFMQTVDTDPNYDLYNIPLKIRHNNSILLETGEEKKNYHNGIYIDIFAIDRVPDTKLKRKIQKNLSKILLNMKMKISFEDGINPKSIIRCILQLIGKIIPYKLIRKILYSTLKWSKQSRLPLFYYGVDLTFDNEFKEEEIFPLKSMEFEGESFWAPNNPHALLTRTYGDYMELPPEDKREQHSSFIGLKKQ